MIDSLFAWPIRNPRRNRPKSAVDRCSWYKNRNGRHHAATSKGPLGRSAADAASAMAYTYVIADAYKNRLTDEVWVLEHFRLSHLNRYLSQFPS